RAEALAALERADAERVDQAAKDAGVFPDYSSASASPRRDMDSALAHALGIDPSRTLAPDKVAFLLNGLRADGQDIAGKKKQSATEALRTVFGLARDRVPDRLELERVLAGQKANGEPLPSDVATRAVQRFQLAMGVKGRDLTPPEREHLLSGRGAFVRELALRQYQKPLHTGRAPIDFVDRPCSAPKSVSSAWEF